MWHMSSFLYREWIVEESRVKIAESIEAVEVGGSCDNKNIILWKKFKIGKALGDKDIVEAISRLF